MGRNDRRFHYYIPVHASPDPVKPALQAQEKESEWLTQVAFEWHGFDLQ